MVFDVYGAEIWEMKVRTSAPSSGGDLRIEVKRGRARCPTYGGTKNQICVGGAPSPAKGGVES